MNKSDMIAQERHMAAAYRREARARRKKYPELASLLESWGDASTARAERMRCGPLFGQGGDL